MIAVNRVSNNPATVLIVDDNPTNLAMLFEYLDDNGFDVLVAEDGQSALEQAHYAKPEIILLDIMMPGMDGFETCRRLRENPGTAHIPVIFMTALTDATDKVRGFEVGAVDYIGKPFQHEEVLVRIDNHLKIRHLQRDLEARNSALEREIHKRKDAEMRLQQHVAQLEEYNAELDAFARTVAHDLREPLNALVGYAELMASDSGLDADHREAASAILSAGTAMGRITDALLLLARVRDTEVVLEPLDMAEVVATSKQRLVHALRSAGAELSVADTWPESLGYSPWVEQVWTNYISNAIKYGGRPPIIELGWAQRSGGMVAFWTRDNGPGITEAQRERLFIEFSQLHRESARGHGLGLSIVRRIVEKLGGEVGVTGDSGGGSTFWFTLRSPSGERSATSS